jgi:hypothetical protein
MAASLNGSDSIRFGAVLLETENDFQFTYVRNGFYFLG